MLESLLEAFRTVTDVNTFTALVTAGVVFTVYTMIKAITGSLLLGTLFLPFLAMGGLAGNYLFDAYYIVVANDKDANTVIAVSSGVLTALIVMTILAKLVGSLIEWKFSRNRRPERFVAADLRAK